MRQILQSVTILLQSATGITKCDDYYKVRQYSVTLLTYQIGFVPHFGAVLTPIRIVAEANNYEREMEPTET